MRTKYHEDFDLVKKGFDYFLSQFQDWIDFNFPIKEFEYYGPQLPENQLIKCLDIAQEYVYDRTFMLSSDEPLLDELPQLDKPFIHSPEYLEGAVARLHEFHHLILPHVSRGHHEMFKDGSLVAFSNFVSYAFNMWRMDFMRESELSPSSPNQNYEKTKRLIFIDAELASLAKISISSIRDFKKDKSNKGSEKLLPIGTKSISLMRASLLEKDGVLDSSLIDDINEIQSGISSVGVKQYYTYLNSLKWLCLRNQYKPTQFVHPDYDIPIQSVLKQSLKRLDPKFISSNQTALNKFLPDGFFPLFVKNKASISLPQILLLDHLLHNQNSSNSDYKPFENVNSL